MTVPNGAVAATITLRGAAGQGNEFGVTGGHGDSVNINMPVTSGQQLQLQVGCAGGYGGGGAPSNSYAGGAGGGASAISENGSSQLYAVAGGGGGAGGQLGTAAQGDYYGAAGAGGDADMTGGDGTAMRSDPAAYAGNGGVRGSAGGQGGQGGVNPQSGNGIDGGTGSFLQGGGGGAAGPGASTLGGGGGGGGFNGGGGGGGGSMWSAYDGGGGGGGGSSYVNDAAGVTMSSASATVTGDGSVTVTYSYSGAVIVSPSPVQFGKVLSVSGSSSTQTVTLTDVGSGSDGPVTLRTVHIGNPGTFDIVGDACSGQSLNSGQSCAVQVRYTPVLGSDGDEANTLVFPSNSISGDIVTGLDATAILPADLAVLPGSVAFGSMSTTSTATQTVAVFNTGDQRLNVSAPSLGGPDADQFTIVAQQNLCPARLPAGGSCTLQVRFSPTRPGDAEATLLVSSDNAYFHPTVAVPLTGTGTAPAPGPTNGVDGTNGINGTNGVAGTNGTNGTNGVDGAKGTNGTNGTNGIDGAKGTNGIDGTNGVDGGTGPRGPAGPARPTEELSAVTLRSRSLTACMDCRSTGLVLTYRLARAGGLHLTMQRKTARGWRPVGSETVAASGGRHKLALGATFDGHKLRGGSYRLVVQAQNSTTSSKAVTLNFRVATSRAGTLTLR
ncbi:choice-of-anchor D domain-containing protein [Paraconexibacter antarcticus]|uniref:choice-of-anchor D domain-containing protein n=1 Tax=Paraconexibacter antarcticus TaxID=2949664 RepID=UPI0026668FD2|nr:choice-of-anchor D domain-containing protein [Paraconexibacter antarcticus]